MPIRGSPNGAPLTLIHSPPGPVDAIARNRWTPSLGMRWTPSIGTAGRHQSESVVAINRCAQSSARPARTAWNKGKLSEHSAIPPSKLASF